MYTLITANRNYSSWSLRPWVLMRALNIPFVDRIEPFTQAVNWDAFRSFSPTGQVPVLIDGETTQCDSLGITLYLADRHAGIWPEAAEARAFAQAVVCEMHGGFSALRNRCTMNVGVRAAMTAIPDDLARDIARITEIFAEGLDRFGGPWLAGAAFTAADAFYAPVAWRIRTYGLDVGPRGAQWVDAVIAHPAMQAWEAAALAETWREEEHEADLARCGAITADYRAS
jgi:glutathione S-transferase